MMHAMSEHAGVGVLPFDGMGLYEQPRPPRLVFKMPRVVPDQKAKFESDELFRRLSRESEVSPPRKGREREAPAWITLRIRCVEKVTLGSVTIRKEIAHYGNCN